MDKHCYSKCGTCSGLGYYDCLTCAATYYLRLDGSCGDNPSGNTFDCAYECGDSNTPMLRAGVHSEDYVAQGGKLLVCYSPDRLDCYKCRDGWQMNHVTNECTRKHSTLAYHHSNIPSFLDFISMSSVMPYLLGWLVLLDLPQLIGFHSWLLWYKLPCG